MFAVEWQGKAVGTNKRLDTNRKGQMYKNKEYTAFQECLIYTIKSHTPKKHMGNIFIHLSLTISSQRDIDSLIKPILDCLQIAEVIDNDKNVRWLLVEKVDKKNKELDIIRILVDEIKNIA